MHTAVHNLVAQGLVCTLGQLILDDDIGSHLNAPVTARPILRIGKQHPAYSAVPVILDNVPALYVANWLRWVAAVRMRTQVDFQKTDHRSIAPFCHEDGQWHR